MERDGLARAGRKPGVKTERSAEPGSRDPVATRAAILRAAIVEFADRGVGGARVAAIAEASGYSKRMIYHYFTNREGLFVAALESIYSEFRMNEDQLSLRDLTPAAAMVRLVRHGWQHVNRHPEFISLLNSENLNKAQYLKKSKVIRDLQTPLLHTIQELLDRGAKEDVFRSDVDAVQFYMTMSAVSYFYLSNIHTLSTIFGTNFSSRKAKAAREEHIVEVVMAYLCCHPAVYRKFID